MNDQILAVSIEARINKLEREMRKASAITGKNFDAMEKRSKRAAGDIEKHFAGIGDRIGGIGKNIAAGFIGGLVAGGITGVAAKFADVAKSVAQIGDEAKRAGLDVRQFQELQYVAEQNRLGVDSLVDGIKELNINADEFILTGGGTGAEAFQRLGYNAESLREKLKDPSALFTEIIGKLGSLDRAAQIRIADEIFGGTGGERFVQLIEQGEQGLNRTRQEAHQLGLVLSAETIAKADELDRKFNAIANTVGTALKQAIVDATGAMVDFINSLPKSDAEALGDMQARVADVRAELEELTRHADSAFPSLTGAIYDVVAAFLANKTSAEDAKTAMLEMARANPDFAPIAGDINGLISLLTMLTGQAREAASALASVNMDSVGTMPTFDEFGAALAPPTPAPAPTPTSWGRGGGGRSSAMREERDTAKELIAELENELRLIGMSEIEKRIDAELRRAGASATDGQKQSIRELVMAIETESAAMDQMQSAMDNAKGMAKDFLGGLLSDLRNGVDGATALANAFGRLADKLLDMALDQLINSLFANLMGGAGGGLFGGLFGFKEGGIVEAATGGLIRGPGTATSDSIPARLSDGEFVVRASQTAKHLDLLRAINDGKVAAFATGGLVGASASLQAANSNIRHANDNSVATSVNINAPVTVNASGGTAEQNADLAKTVARTLEGQLRGLVADEMRVAMRPGNMANARSR
ncbi:hypothetical protein [Devosia riboflavina]|uniref:hypothetical protein n=1 Tax=Devosia riboflavina TaxID=46914 RepID=UPI00068D529F|nr:hypothetical protein [Devosia riboflavina]